MTIYKHYKNGKEYIVINYCKIQEGNDWVDAILYKEVGGSLLFVRSEDNFNKSFILDNSHS